MAVRPAKFISDSQYEIWHDEKGHGGTINVADIEFPRTLAGDEDLRFIIVRCPVPGCKAHSLHPCTGGCDQPMVQRLFARVLMHRPATPRAANPQLPNAAKRSWAEAKAALKELARGQFALGNGGPDD